MGSATGKADPLVSNANGISNAEDHGSTGFPDKLLKAAILFIANSLKLHTVVIDSVRIKVDLLSILGEALSTTKSGKIISLLRKQGSLRIFLCASKQSLTVSMITSHFTLTLIDCTSINFLRQTLQCNVMPSSLPYSCAVALF